MNIDSWAGEFFLTYLYVILNLVAILIDYVKFKLSPSSDCLLDFTYHGVTALHAIMRLGSGLLEVREIVTEDSIKIPCSYDCCYKVRSSLHTGVHKSKRSSKGCITCMHVTHYRIGPNQNQFEAYSTALESSRHDTTIPPNVIPRESSRRSRVHIIFDIFHCLVVGAFCRGLSAACRRTYRLRQRERDQFYL